MAVFCEYSHKVSQIETFFVINITAMPKLCE